MPRKTKDQIELDIEKKETKTTASKKAVNKSTTKKATVKSTTKKAPAKSTTKKVATKSAAKKTVSKSVAKKTTTKAKSTARTTTKKAASTKKSVIKAEKVITSIEYYDLPSNYDKTVVKVLAQTPNTLFIYWDISNKDKELYKEQFGENFFETSIPILKIYNDTLNYSFEIEINDFANSWYLTVNDSNCDYRVELFRKEKANQSQYVYVSSSNEIESPNDKILFNKEQKMIYFKNVKTNNVNSKDISTLSFIRNMGKIYNIYDLYKEIYKNENLDEYTNQSSSKF